MSPVIPSTMYLWNMYRDEIVMSSKLPQDLAYVSKPMIETLWYMITPRLPFGIRSTIRTPAPASASSSASTSGGGVEGGGTGAGGNSNGQRMSIDAILSKIYHRYTYLQQQVAQKKKNTKNEFNSETTTTSVRPPIPPPPKLQILVMGGSVTIGDNCFTGLVQPTDEMYHNGKDNSQCAWRYRLQSLLNTFVKRTLFGGGNENENNASSNIDIDDEIDDDENDDLDLVEVITVGQGGTNSEIGSYILQYDIVPPNAHHPDIIINSYSTNDMHSDTLHQAKTSRGKDITLEEHIFDILQNYTRSALSMTMMEIPHKLPHDSDGRSGTSSSSSCDDSRPSKAKIPPLVIHLNDYLGNEQKSIYGTMSLTRAMSMVSSYYGINSVSYADMIRDYVYGDTKEYWFSPPGWYSTRNYQYQKEIHPKLQAHMTIAYLLAYDLLDILTTRCSSIVYETDTGQLSSTSSSSSSSSVDTTERNHPGKPTGDVGTIQWYMSGKPPLPPQHALLPLLTKQLDLPHMSELWWKEENEKLLKLAAIAAENKVNSSCLSLLSTTSSSSSRCPFGWIEGTKDNRKLPENWVETYFAPYTVGGASTTSDWYFTTKSKKRGFVPRANTNKQQQPKLIWEFPLSTIEQDQQVRSSITSITLFTMKSYSEDWYNSLIRFDVYRKIVHKKKKNNDDADNNGNREGPTTTLLLSKEISGYHDKQTSETYVTTMEIPPSAPQLSLRDSAEAASTAAGSTGPDDTTVLLRVEFTLLSGNTFKLQGFIACTSTSSQ